MNILGSQLIWSSRIFTHVRLCCVGYIIFIGGINSSRSHTHATRYGMCPVQCSIIAWFIQNSSIDHVSCYLHTQFYSILYKPKSFPFKILYSTPPLLQCKLVEQIVTHWARVTILQGRRQERFIFGPKYCVMIFCLMLPCIWSLRSLWLCTKV